MNISITGFSGTGKTTISRLLAARLDKKLISTDDEVLKKTKLAAEKFVKKYGWEKLLEVECDIIENISDLDEFILDAGSGIILRNENITNLKRNGILVFLTADLRAISGRIKKSEEKEDFIKSSHIGNAEEILRQCEEKCRKSADYTIDTSDMSPEEACDIIVHYVKMEMQ